MPDRRRTGAGLGNYMFSLFVNSVFSIPGSWRKAYKRKQFKQFLNSIYTVAIYIIIL